MRPLGIISFHEAVVGGAWHFGLFRREIVVGNARKDRGDQFDLRWIPYYKRVCRGQELL